VAMTNVDHMFRRLYGKHLTLVVKCAKLATLQGPVKEGGDQASARSRGSV
jgi:hypothetical protein